MPFEKDLESVQIDCTQSALDEDKLVTGIIEFLTQKDSDPEVEEILAAFEKEMIYFKGYLGRDILKFPVKGGVKHVVVLMFSCYMDLRVWLTSEERQQILARAPSAFKAQRITAQNQDEVVKVGGDAGFEVHRPVSARPPPKWKLAITTEIAVFSAVYCVIEAGIPEQISSHVRHSFALTTIGTNLCVVPPLVYAVVPLLTKLLGPWLRIRRPQYKCEPLRTLDEGLALFVPPSPPIDASGVAKLQERVDRLEATLKRMQAPQNGTVVDIDTVIPTGQQRLPVTGQLEGLTQIHADISAAGVQNKVRDLAVTGIAHHHVKWECEVAFLELVKEFRKQQEAHFPGFLSLVTLHGQTDGLSHSQEFVNIWKYRSFLEMEEFSKSQIRQDFLNRLQPLLESKSKIKFEQGRYMHDAFSEMFVNPGDNAPSKPPPVWKTAFLVFTGLLCVWPVNQNLSPVLTDAGIQQTWLITLILTSTNVTVNTWVCVPFLIFLFGGWLNKSRPEPSCIVCSVLDRGLPYICVQLFVAVVYYGGLITLIATKAF